jgi:hypothetical protein
VRHAAKAHLCAVFLKYFLVEQGFIPVRNLKSYERAAIILFDAS